MKTRSLFLFVSIVAVVLMLNTNMYGQTAPVVDSTASVVTSITRTSAVCGGYVGSSGDSTLIERGVCYNTTGNPTISDNVAKSGKVTAVNKYEPSYLEGLQPNTKYYVRAYATSKVGTGYGNEITFTTSAGNAEASWPLISDFVAETVGNINASVLDTTNFPSLVSGWNLGPEGNFLYDGYGWLKIPKTSKMTAAFNSNFYLEFAVSPTPGQDFTVEGISLGMLGYKTGQAKMAAYYSLSAFATDSSALGPATVADSVHSKIDATVDNPISLLSGNPPINTPMGREYISFSPNITVKDGQTLTVRLYVWGKNGATIGIKKPVITGSASASSPSRMVAHWPMDEGSGTLVSDVVGGNNGTMVGLDPATAWITDGALGGAVRFANINDQRIEVPHADAIEFGDESFTISLLVRYVTPPQAGDTDRWLIKGTHFAPGTGCRYELYHTGGPEVRFTLDDNVTKTDLKVSNAAFITGGWIHVVAVRDVVKDTLYLYANGVLQGQTLDKTGDISNGEVLWIGESTDEHNTPMSGDIDDVRIYNYAMSADKIDELYNSYDIFIPRKIAWVNANDSDSGFVQLLKGAGHKVQVETDTLKGELTPDQKKLLNSFDLVIMSRNVNSGDYNAPTSWNTLSVPLIQLTPYLVRSNRWQWINSSSLLTEGGTPPYVAQDAGHAIFDGVTLDASNQVQALDPAAGIGYATYIKVSTVGADGQVLATDADSGYVTIAYWPAGASFYNETYQNAGGPRMFFMCGTREGTKDGVTALQGEYNLTADGDKMLINAINFMVKEGPGPGDIMPDAKIVWVSANSSDSGFVAMLEAAGEKVTVETDTFKGVLTTEQVDYLNTADLIIHSRNLNSGDYNAPASWNALTVPLIQLTPYLVRSNRWQWINSSSLLTEGGTPPYVAQDAGHAIFDGVTLDASNQVQALDPTAGIGYATYIKERTVGGGGQILATDADSGYVTIAYWPSTMEHFYEGSEYNPGGPRMFFMCGTREGTKDGVTALQGEYNLTANGDKMLINAIHFMAAQGPGVGPDTTTGVEGKTVANALTYKLMQNYPNPFNPVTNIQFQIPKDGHVTVSVYNVVGQRLATLVDKNLQSGVHHITFDAAGFSSGIYFYKIQVGDFTKVKKMMLLK